MVNKKGTISDYIIEFSIEHLNQTAQFNLQSLIPQAYSTLSVLNRQRGKHFEWIWYVNVTFRKGQSLEMIAKHSIDKKRQNV